MKDVEELRALRGDLTAQMGAKDQVLVAYMQFLSATVRLAEPLVVRELPVALGGDDSDRVAWAVKAGPICRAVSETVIAEKAPDSRTELLRKICGDALNSYAMLADEWIDRKGVHTERAHSDLVSGMSSWERAVDHVEAVWDRLAGV